MKKAVITLFGFLLMLKAAISADWPVLKKYEKERTYKIVILFIFLITTFPSCIKQGSEISKQNVVWKSPGENSFGSMPLGNGDVGVNVWMEKDGDLVLYISKVDAFDCNHVLPKLGRVRIKAEPAIVANPFKQTLCLRDASILIESGDVKLRIWVDANNSLIKIEGKSRIPRVISVSLESIRPLENSSALLPESGTAGILFEGLKNSIAWCYRNQSSVWTENLKRQNSQEIIAKASDPLLHRTSGCIVEAAGFTSVKPSVLRSEGSVKKFGCTINVLSSQTGSIKEWLDQVSVPVRPDWKAHCGHWRTFWDRSYINITSAGEGKLDLNQARFANAAHDSLIYEGFREIDNEINISQINQRYALERFCQSIASRGEIPPPFNGSIFTMDMPAGTHQFIEKGLRKTAVDADNRDWQGLPVFWQNTRHPYWSMLARGDYEEMMPAFKTIRGTLEIGKDRTRTLFNHEGAFMNEGIYWKGVSVFNDLPHHLQYHYLGTIEMTAVMCDYYEYSQDNSFLTEVLLPCADEFIKFYDLHYPRKDESGKRIIEPAGVTETYQPVRNPVTEVSGLRYLLSKLLTFDEDVTGKARKDYWRKLLNEMPYFPGRTIRGIELLAPGQKYAGRLICETPELYAVWPFRQIPQGSEFYNNARQSFHVRQISLDGTDDSQSWETGGWQSAPIWAAYLGLPREAARLVSMNFNDRFANFTYRNEDMEPPDPEHPRPRFPAFWETKMDYTPDNDHGAVTVNALQSMLLQCDGKKILLLPAWPEEWNVTFRLHASFNTVVDCDYEDGKVRRLSIIPESRRSDIIDMSTAEERIRSLVEVAQCDRNYLFGLPPMLDAKPVPGKTTRPWIDKFGYTLEGCKAGPWKNSVFSRNIAYVHVHDWPKENVKLGSIPFRLVSAESITGKIQVKETGDGWILTGIPDPFMTIVKLEFDTSLEGFAYSIPSEGSYTKGKIPDIRINNDGIVTASFISEEEIIVSRFEFTISNPGHIRGHGNPFSLQVMDETGKWVTVYEDKVYGTICGKKIDPVKTKAVRLIVQANSVKQFDIFKNGTQ